MPRPKPSASAERIATAVRRLIVEPSFRANARTLGAGIRADAASPALVDELEHLEHEGAVPRRAS